MLKVIFEDQDILVVEKPSGIESQSSRKMEPDMVSEIKKHIFATSSTKLSPKPSTVNKEPYVGVIHRLDKPVSGIMVYAKNQKAAAALSKQVQDGKMKKIYQAVICGQPVDNVGNYVDYLLREGKNNYSRVVDKNTPGCKRAELKYRVLSVREEKGQAAFPFLSLVEIELMTGRHHQIRVQFKAHGLPLWGDNKYNPEWGGQDIKGFGSSREFFKQPVKASGKGSLALAAVRLSFLHPVTGKPLEFSKKAEGAAFQLFEEKNAIINEN